MPFQPVQPQKSADKCALRAEGVTKRYRLGEVDVVALHGIDLCVNEKDFLALAGSSGSGKTTLLNLLGCIDRPTEGSIYIDDIDTVRLNGRQLADFRSQKLGFIFQTFNLLPILTASENVEYPLILLKVPPPERRKRVREALAKVGLEKFLNHRPAQLSGGQRQRVAIARAMVKRPRMVLADEPTANLDKTTAVGIVDLMHDLNRNEGVTFVFSSHDPMILARSSHIVYLSDGRKVQPPQSVNSCGSKSPLEILSETNAELR